MNPKKNNKATVHTAKSLLQETKEILAQHGISPDIFQHQNFCIDKTVLEKVAHTGNLSKNDIVLEIGAGTGLLTKIIAKKAKKVIAIEKDRRLEPLLQDLPKNIEMLFADALQVLLKRKDFNKIVANIPYQTAEPLLKILCTALHVEKTVLMVPRIFAVRVAEHPYFSAFFAFEILLEVPKEAFYPQPKVKSAILAVIRRREMNDDAFLRQQLFLQQEKKIKNALRESLITLARWKKKSLSKNEAKKILKEDPFLRDFLEQEGEEVVGRVKLKKIKEIVQKLTELYASSPTTASFPN